ncbi:hypothetical protein Q4Q35_06680 [Flavivirga aquimarina]|uniref:SGNH/GDSL hydrolase family protein n=1 Tax=Flavivirga aquimarina TaxID=2027862 RepID=A0ABT8W8M4_9FLAO|nr:hypothetical protein [Flavivirga aquimarina]MDO5969485.1 hypothetical protein [Flavivirga aquimarina]
MKTFFIKIIKHLFIFLIILEIVSRVFIDPLFFFSLDTFRNKSCKTIKCILEEPNDKPDYIFMGSSRVAALVNLELLTDLTGNKNVLNSARGYMTPGIMIQALKSKLRETPDFLSDSKVFLEYYGQGSLTNLYIRDQLKVYETYTMKYSSQPQFILPYLNFSDLKDFWSVSSNSWKVKVNLTVLYFSASYRCALFMNEKFNYADKVLYKGQSNVSESGGIRSDDIENTIQFAAISAEKKKQRILSEPYLTQEILAESSLSELNNLVRENGGELVLFKTPLHSISKEIFNTQKSKLNNQVFIKWLNTQKINLIEPENFNYKDEDFLDILHINPDRKDEYTHSLYNQILVLENLLIKN